MVFQALQWQLRATPNDNSWKISIIMPPYYGSTILSTYDIHNKISLWDHSEAISFWPYVLAFEATVPLILWSKCLNFFCPKRLLYMSAWPHKMPESIDKHFFPSVHPKGVCAIQVVWPKVVLFFVWLGWNLGGFILTYRRIDHVPDFLIGHQGAEFIKWPKHQNGT